MTNLSVLQSQLHQAALNEEREAKKYDIQCQKVLLSINIIVGSS